MLLLSVILFFSSALGLERRISYTKNPGCEKYSIALHYLKAEGPNDTLHYLWDFTNAIKSRKPTVFLALTDVNDTFTLNCTDFVYSEANSISFSEKPKYEFFLVLNELIEFDDINDTGVLTAQSPKISYDIRNFVWSSGNATVDDKGRFVNVQVAGSWEPDSQLSGSLDIQLTAFGFENHDSELPRLLHSPNSTQCKITLNNLISNSNFNSSRYAIEFILVSSDEKNSSSKITTRKNLDDENSPGIFSMVDVMTPKAQNQLFQGAFLQWRPILYTSKVPSLSVSSETVTYNVTEVRNPNETLADTLSYLYYGNDLDTVLVEQIILSMGITEDGFYKKTNYSSWTFLINYGSPEEEKFSLLVILVMCIGLGLPALLILVGGSYMCARRIRRSKDELSLER